MERARAAKGKQRKGTRIVAAFDGNAAQGALHAGVGYAKDAFGEMFEGREGLARIAAEGRRARASSSRMAPPRK